MKSLLFPLVFLLSISGSKSVNYELYTFESFWLGTTCKFAPCLANETDFASHNFFNIHGLWPDYLVGYPAYCDNSSIYQAEDIALSLQGLMKVYWIGMNESSDQFHAHEWSKHGTCWNDPIQTQNQTTMMNDYFSAAIAVAFKIDMYSTLANAGIIPSETPYTYDQFSNALNNSWGPGSFGLDCQTDTSGNQYLNDINICLSLDYSIVSCPTYVTESCVQGNIYYIPINFGDVPSTTKQAGATDTSFI
jgi:ribonuclease T2